jgi:hypothetical protein
MKIGLRISAFASLAAAALLAAPAQALVVAGWDFSQYLGDSLLTLDGVNGATTLSANYSNLDPTFNAGAESANFGTMYIDGQFGSTSVDPFNSPQIVPSAIGSLASNLTAPVQAPGDNEFDSHTILQFEGQLFANFQSMTAFVPSSMVFQADLGVVPQFGENWQLSFGGQTFSGTSVLDIEYSLDGTVYTALPSIVLTVNDTPYVLDLFAGGSDTMFVKFTFTGANPAGQPLIDNVALEATIVPEPGTLLLVGSGLAGLVGFGRRRA